MSADVAVAVLGCDRIPYARCWAPMHAALTRFWPDRPWPVVLFTQQATPRFDGWTVVPTRAPADEWGRHVMMASRLDAHRWWLVLMDDYLADAPWDTAALVHAIGAAESRDAKYCRVQPTPGPNAATTDPRIGICLPGAEYRFSLQPTFIEREYFGRMAAGVATPWDFELYQHGDAAALHLSVVRGHKPVAFRNALVKGRWQPDAAALCRREGWTDPFQ